MFVGGFYERNRLRGGIMKTKLIKILTLVVIISVIAVFTGCTEAQRVSRNVSKEADNFNTVRQITVMNCIQDDVLFQMTGKNINHC